MRYVLCSLVLATGSMAGAAESYRPPQLITAPKPLRPETALVKDARAQATIIVPQDPVYAPLAQAVADRIKAATGAHVPVKTDDQYSEADKKQHLICLGQMLNNRLAFELYVHHYVAADDWFPGPDGWELRTVCDPWGNGSNVIMLGGSDAAGVQRAIERFCALLKPGPDWVLPRLLDTGFRDKAQLDQWLPAYLERFKSEFLDQPHLPYGNESRLIDMARYYHLTGDDRLAISLSAGIRHWMVDYYRYIPERQITQPKYLIPLMIMDWDVIEEHPAFSDELRLEYTNLLYDYVARMSVHSRISQLKPGVLSGTGHHRVSLTVSYGSRYFKAYYPHLPMDRIDAGLATVRTGLDTIKNTYGFFDENGGYTQFYPTTTMWNSLFLGDLTYFTSGNARQWLRQSLIYLDNLGAIYCGPSESYGIGEWFYRDGQWAWLQDKLYAREDYYAQITGSSRVLTAWSYRPQVKPVEPTQWLEGIQWLPVHETVYAQLQGRPHLINVPREKTFHVLSLRPRFNREAEYLRLDGINAGLDNGGDGNAIVSLTAKGQSWLTSGKWGQAYRMKYHNSVMVLRDGQMTDKLVALCSLEAAANLPSCGLMQSVMREYHGTDWARSIVWLKDGYFVVCDTLRAREAGDYSFLCRWRAAWPGELQDNIFQMRASGKMMDIASCGGQLQDFLDEGVQLFSEAQHGTLQAGDCRTFINLLRARGAGEAPVRLARLSPEAALVLDPQEPAVVGAALPIGSTIPTTKLGNGLVVSARLFYLSATRLCAADLTRLEWTVPLLAAEKPVSVEIDLVSGNVSVLEKDGGLQVLSPQLKDAGAREKLREALAIDLKELSARLLPDEPAAAAHPQPSRNAWVWRPAKPNAVRCLASDVSGRQTSAVAIGTEDGSVVRLDADGTEIWTFNAENRINDVAVDDVDGDGKAEVLAASDDFNLYCLDAAGKEKWRFNTAGIDITNQTAGVYGPGLHITSDGEVAAVRPVDLDGDGNKELLVGTETFTHGSRRVFGTIFCLECSGRLKWHLYQSGGTVSSLDTADVNGDGKQEILIGTSGTYAVADYLIDSEGQLLARYNTYEGVKEKACRFARTLSSEFPRAVHLDMSRALLEAYGTSPSFARAWQQPCGGLGGCGPAVADLDGDGTEEIVAGSNAGSVYAVKETSPGQVSQLWRTNLQDAISIVIAADVSGDARPEIIAGSHAGGVYVLGGEKGKVTAYYGCGEPITSLTTVQLSAGTKAAIAAGTRAGTVTLCAVE